MVGAYELSVPLIQFSTGLNSTDITKSLQKFQDDKKIIYLNNYVVLLNHLKYQDYSKGSFKQKKAFEREKKLLPDMIQDIVDKRGDQTSSELVTNQLETIHKSKIINHKSKNIKEEKNKKFLNKWNEVMKTNLKSSKSWESNLEKWLEDFTEDDILKAIENIPRHNWLKDKATPDIFFRTNQSWIDQCLNIKKRAPVVRGQIFTPQDTPRRKKVSKEVLERNRRALEKIIKKI